MATYVRWCQRPLHHCKPRPTAGTLMRVRRRQPSVPRRTAGRRRWSYRRPLLLPWFRWSDNNRLSRDDDRLQKKNEFHIPIFNDRLNCLKVMSGCRSCSGRLFHGVVPAVTKQRSLNWSVLGCISWSMQTHVKSARVVSNTAEPRGVWCSPDLRCELKYYLTCTYPSCPYKPSALLLKIRAQIHRRH